MSAGISSRSRRRRCASTSARLESTSMSRQSLHGGIQACLLVLAQQLPTEDGISSTHRATQHNEIGCRSRRGPRVHAPDESRHICCFVSNQMQVAQSSPLRGEHCKIHAQQHLSGAYARSSVRASRAASRSGDAPPSKQTLARSIGTCSQTLRWCPVQYPQDIAWSHIGKHLAPCTVRNASVDGQSTLGTAQRSELRARSQQLGSQCTRWAILHWCEPCRRAHLYWLPGASQFCPAKLMRASSIATDAPPRAAPCARGRPAASSPRRR